MKRKITSLLPIVIFTMFSFTIKATNVSGGIYVNTTWTLANSPYIVTDTVVVFPGITLTIQPGVVVKFDNNKRLEIRQARIIAIGTVTNSITFTSNSGFPTVGIYAGIYLNRSQLSEFYYCNIFYANYGIQPNAMYCLGSCDSVLIKRTKFCYNSNGIYNAFQSHIIIDSCIFRYNTYGIRYSTGSIFAKNSTFNNNQNGISSPERSSYRHCVIDSNSVYGVFTQQGDTITDCEIKYNGTGIQTSGSGNGTLIYKNNINNNTVGIELWPAGGLAIYCNNLCNNTNYDLKYTGTTNTNMMANNYWCTADSTTTAIVVYDGYDNASYGLVNFMPLDTLNCYLSGCNLLISVNVTNATCATCPDGSATATVLNGFAPYTYTWYSSPIQTTQTATGLPSGMYTICVTDANGCSTCDSVFVDSTNCSGFSLTTNATNATCTSCNDGTAIAIPTGGSGPYNYTWYTIPMQTTDSISGLAQGTYAVCVTDVNGCTVCDSATVSIGNCSAHFNLYADTIPQHYLAINMASGVLPLTYNWSWGDGTFSTTAFPSHTYATSGFYTICLSITDSVGCTNTYCSSYYLLMPQSLMVYVNVYPPGGISVGVNDNINNESVTLIPNPFTEQTTITFAEPKTSASSATHHTIKIMDVIGKEIKTINFTGKQFVIEKGEMNAGVYFIRIVSTGSTTDGSPTNVVNRKVIVN